MKHNDANPDPFAMETEDPLAREARFGELVRRYREMYELSQAQLAEWVGLYPTAITKLEHGQRPIRLAEAFALADALGIPIARLIAESSDADDDEEISRLEAAAERARSTIAQMRKDLQLTDEEIARRRAWRAGGKRK